VLHDFLLNHKRIVSHLNFILGSISSPVNAPFYIAALPFEQLLPFKIPARQARFWYDLPHLFAAAPTIGRCAIRAYVVSCCGLYAGIAFTGNI